MTTISNEKRLAALFAADSHFHTHPDHAETVRRDRFLGFLEYAAAARHLVLLGDIFDFWFDYPHFALRGYEPILSGLDQLHATGTRIHFVGGNHDVWAAPYLHARYGCAADGRPLTLNLDGLRIRCVHGDGILGKEFAYRAFRAIVRHRLGVTLAKSLHPEVLFAVSTWLSGHSRAASRDEISGIETKAAKYLRRVVQADPDWDVLVIGHVHHPLSITAGTRTLVSLGGWLDSLNYAQVTAGCFEHAVFNPAEAAQPPR